MGAWGPAIFSDDTACDVRDAYKQAIVDGLEGPAATDRILGSWLEQVSDDDEDAVVMWLALAATQSRLGRLEDRVRDRALEIIESGQDLPRWRESGGEAARQKHLDKLKAQLLGPQPAPKRIRVEQFYVPEWKAGDYVAYRLLSGKQVIFYVHDVNEQTCVCTALDWCGDEIPDEGTIRSLPERSFPRTPHRALFSLYTQKKKGIPHDRLRVLPFKGPTPPTYDGGDSMWEWGESLNFNLKDHWGWE